MAAENEKKREKTLDSEEELDELINERLSIAARQRGDGDAADLESVTTRVKSEKEELTKALKFTRSPGRKKLAANLIDRAAFMRVTLQDLEVTMQAQGVVSEYQNGENQWAPRRARRLTSTTS